MPILLSHIPNRAIILSYPSSIPQNDVSNYAGPDSELHQEHGDAGFSGPLDYETTIDEVGMPWEKFAATPSKRGPKDHIKRRILANRRSWKAK